MINLIDQLLKNRMFSLESGVYYFLEKEISYLLNVSIHFQLIKNNNHKILLKSFLEEFYKQYFGGIFMNSMNF